ncbi:MAG: branched-chain amino acid ABC transporter permease [Pseudomonadota bacterium]
MKAGLPVRNGYELAVIAGLLAVALVAPFFLYPLFLMKVYYLALFAIAFSLLFGFGGLLSFGHCAYFGTAAYLTGHAIKIWDFPPELGILFGVACGTVLGVVFGAMAIRRSGIYFAMITFALAEMIYFLANRLPFTGGENGLTQVPRGVFLGLFNLKNEITMYYVTLAVFALGFFVFVRAIRSPFGLALRAIKQNETRAESLGYKVSRFKLLAFALSAFLASLAGAMKVVVIEFASLSDVHWQLGGQAILMALLGGVTTFLGPLLGAVIVLLLEEYLAFLGQWVTFITGAIFVICVLTFRRGILGELPDLWNRLRSRQGRTDPVVAARASAATDGAAS